MFAVVEFITYGTVDIIPVEWFTSAEEDECFWLDTEAKHKVSKLVQTSANPNKNWNKYKIRTLGKAVTYQRAVEKCKVAEYSSDLQTDREEDDKRRKRKIIAPADDTNSDSDTSSKMTSKKQKKCHKLSDRQTEYLPPAPPTEFSKTISAAELSVQPHLTSQGCIAMDTHSENANERTEVGDTVSENANKQTESEESVLSQQSEHVKSAKSATTDSLILGILMSMEEMKQTQKEIQETQRIQTNMLHILLQHYNKSADKTELPDDVVFPMQSMDNFREIEERLKNNDFANALIGYLSDLGGRDIWETTKRIMKFLMVKNLAILFNMQGTKGKRSFSTSEIFTVIYKAIKKSACTRDCNRKDVEQQVGKWLGGARDWDGGRTERDKREKQKKTNSVDAD
ncbi:uncharacterized protein LOC136084783 isoform X1 [Hydra vulgaris]|uniref:Uncharacterized protein LOC136084783 isoform X1 n=1 Tax=Hydra vulgaris TaxID=6087 RepID=A0ABM4CJ40_HYDVU